MVFFGCLAKAMDLEPKPDSDNDKHNNNKNANNIGKFQNAIVINKRMTTIMLIIANTLNVTINLAHLPPSTRTTVLQPAANSEL